MEDAVLDQKVPVAEAEEQATGKRMIPDSREEIDAVLEKVDPARLQALMPDRKHALLDVAVPLHVQDSIIDEIVVALGGGGETVTDPGQVGPAIDRAMASGLPYLVNVMTDRDAAYPRSTLGI